MNIFKLLGFRKILFCFFKACFMIFFNMFFFLLLIDEFVKLPILAEIIWFRYAYFTIFYSILFYLFCFYLRKDLDKLENLPELKLARKKIKKSIEEKEVLVNKRENISKKPIISQKRKRRISKKKLASNIFFILLFIIVCLGIIILNPWTYLCILFLLLFYTLGGIFGKILFIFFLILSITFPFILFFGDEDTRKSLCDIWLDEE